MLARQGCQKKGMEIICASVTKIKHVHVLRAATDMKNCGAHVLAKQNHLLFKFHVLPVSQDFMLQTLDQAIVIA